MREPLTQTRVHARERERKRGRMLAMTRGSVSSIPRWQGAMIASGGVAGFLEIVLKGKIGPRRV